MPSLITIFRDIPDSRSGNAQRHDLRDILFSIATTIERLINLLDDSDADSNLEEGDLDCDLAGAFTDREDDHAERFGIGGYDGSWSKCRISTAGPAAVP